MKRLVLLAEDDERLAQLVRQFLEEHEFDVVVEGFGHNVPRQVRALNPDLLILDIGLPGMDGLSICRDLRPEFTAPILMLTARDSDLDQVLGFEFGADDYVIKPVEPRVLLARLRALLRRSGAVSEEDTPLIAVGALRIDLAARTVTLASKDVSLTSHEFDLLAVLAQKAGEVLSREYLFNKIYGRPYDGLDRTIDVRISQLRKKLGDDSEQPQKIKTIWGRGYLFVADVW